MVLVFSLIALINICWVDTFLKFNTNICDICYADISEKVFLTNEEALELAFPDSEIVKEQKIFLSDSDKKELKKLLGYTLQKTTFSFYIGITSETINGYAIIDDEKGESKEIKFITTISPDGKVKDVAIMVYHEKYGLGITKQKFLKQFRNKTSKDPLKISKDIKKVTGATYPSYAIATGVKRALILWERFLKK